MSLRATLHVTAAVDAPYAGSCPDKSVLGSRGLALILYARAKWHPVISIACTAVGDPLIHAGMCSECPVSQRPQRCLQACLRARAPHVCSLNGEL